VVVFESSKDADIDLGVASVLTCVWFRLLHLIMKGIRRTVPVFRISWSVKAS